MTVKIPFFVPALFPKAVFNIPQPKPTLYLTFDDGPHPEITAWILQILQNYNIKGTFFCVGENIEKYPLTYSQIIEQNHITANHTYDHLKGWITENKEYFQSIKKTETLIKKKIFRPPYGKLKLSQYRYLTQMNYKIVFWDILSADYSSKITPKICYNRVVNNISNGSIIVFHDSEKAYNNLKKTLPQVIEYGLKNNFQFLTITE